MHESLSIRSSGHSATGWQSCQQGEERLTKSRRGSRRVPLYIMAYDGYCVDNSAVGGPMAAMRIAQSCSASLYQFQPWIKKEGDGKSRCNVM